MFNFFKNLKIFYKALILNAIFALGVIGNLFFSYHSISSSIQHEKEIKLKNFIESAYSYIQSIQKEKNQGNLTEEDAKKRILDYVNSTRFDGGNYFWVQDNQEKMIVHPIKYELNGKFVGDMLDTNGLHLFKEFTKTVKEHGEGYVQYYWPKPGEKEPVLKNSYVKGIDGFNWIIGSGYYIEDLKSAIMGRMEFQYIYMALFLIIAQLCMFIFYRCAHNPMRFFIKTVEDIENGSMDVVIPVLDSDHELSGLYNNFRNIYKKINDNYRLDSGFQSMDSMLVITDYHGIVTQINPSFQRFFEELGAKHFKKHLPDFIIKNGIMGVHIRELDPILNDSLSTLNNAVYTKIEISELDIVVHATPIMNDNSEKLGTIVQFFDHTQETQIKKQVENVMEIARHGDLSVRMNTMNMSGNFKKLGDGINDFIEVMEETISDVAKTMKAISIGDLRCNLEGDYKGVLAGLKTDTNKALQTLQHVIQRIIIASQNLVDASDKINKGSQELSERTEQQASSLEETAASMEELASTVRQTAEHASGANELAHQAQELALDGGAVVHRAVTAMESIEESSKKVTNIMAVIDEIAFQTNLLALNAAVESARAGEAGKGFAVVAEEVRTLAQRSAQASKQIKTFMEESNKNVKNGVTSVHLAGDRLEMIVSASKNVATLISEIANASEEQTSGLEQINITVSEMDQMTQENSMLVEKSTAAADLLNRQADELIGMMSFFKYNQQDLEDMNDEQENADDILNLKSFDNDDDDDMENFGQTHVDIDDSPMENMLIHEHHKVEKKKPAAITNDPDWQDF